MKKGDLVAVITGLFLVIVLMVLLSPPAYRSGDATTPVPTTRAPETLAPVIPVPPVMETTIGPAPELPTQPPVTTKRIFYTDNYYAFPVRYLPSDMSIYGFSDVDWPYNSSVAFAYVEENHGGITETFTVPSPVWRMTSTLYSPRTPEKAKFRMILVDMESGRVLEGAEIRYPGTVTKTVVARGRPVYMVVQAENVERYMIVLEVPEPYT
jgi:hypothetical protein